MNKATENATMKQADKNIVQVFMDVITHPAPFFREMPQEGGLANPLIFLIVISIAGGVVRAILGIAGLGNGGLGMGIATIILSPVLAAIFGFLVAAVLFVIWKILGSQKSYETAYRCMAYGAAIIPITQLLYVIPYAGLILALAWQTYILIVASIEVHKINRVAATAVFGILALALAVMGFSAQMAMHNMQHNLDQIRDQMSQGNDTKDAGKTMQDVGKLMQQFGQDARKHTSGK